MVEAGQLLYELDRIKVHYLIGENLPVYQDHLTPVKLLAGLASQDDARMRRALIAVLLRHPEYSRSAKAVISELPDEQALIFQLYYTAAYYLQAEYSDQLVMLIGEHETMPDYFSEALGIHPNNKESDPLKKLANQHKELSGLELNWLGTYHHTARQVIRRLKKEQEWAAI
jgi:hypothetical protein